VWFLIDGFAERFLECFEKSPSVDFPIDLTSLYALHTDPQEEFWQRIHFAQLAFALPSTRHGYLTDGLGPSESPCEEPRKISYNRNLCAALSAAQ
jgi:hypothetical protein